MGRVDRMISERRTILPGMLSESGPGTNSAYMPPTAVFAGIDQGTTGTRTNLYDEAGAFLATAYRR